MFFTTVGILRYSPQTMMHSLAELFQVCKKFRVFQKSQTVIQQFVVNQQYYSSIYCSVRTFAPSTLIGPCISMAH